MKKIQLKEFIEILGGPESVSQILKRKNREIKRLYVVVAILVLLLLVGVSVLSYIMGV